MIIIDNRENINNFKLDFEHKFENLDIGDFHFIKNDKIIRIVERKTINDYIASIKDGRLHEQAFRMRECGIPCIYIIEGETSEEYILNSVVNKHIHDNFQVFWTKSQEETLVLLARIHKSIESLSDEKKEYLGCAKVKKSTPETVFCQMLMTIPGISGKIAMKICEKYKSMPILIEELKKNPKCLLGLDTGNKKIGKITADKIYSFIIQ